MGERQANIKRRRLNEAASALARPFKSPLRKGEGGGAVHQEASNQNNAVETVGDPRLKDRYSVPVAHKESTVRKTVSHTGSPRDTISTRQLRALHKMDPELAALQKEQISLQSRLATLRSQLDTAQQALQIESSARDEELKALGEKWRKVSQNVADELFVSAKDRVERMGGVSAWRDRERLRKMQTAWDDGDGREIEAPDDFDGVRGVDVVTSAASASGEDDKVFTMDMMLESMNIDSNIIGYDKAEQRWVTP